MKAVTQLILATLIISFFFSACSNTDQQSEDQANLSEILPGTWEAISFRVDIKTINNTEKDSLFEISEEYWIERYQVKPVQTRYKPDNKYVQEYRSLQDSVLSETKGIWNVFGDTLMMIEPNVTYNYIVEANRSNATFKATLDWDGDGVEDDNFVGKYRLISIDY